MASEKNQLTPSQQRAVAARGNVLIMAGAGTGKTHTLVQRCLDLLRQEHAALDEILVVTFTESAAAEMRHRLRAALERAFQDHADPFFAEQLALFDAAHIGTLHSFCLRLVREHFHELGLDPQLSILDEGEARLMAEGILEDQFNDHYEGKKDFSGDVQNLIAIYGNGRDEKIRSLVLRLHRYLQTQPNPTHWLTQQIETYSATDPALWRGWFGAVIGDFCNDWTQFLKTIASSNVKAAECLELLAQYKSGEVLDRILAADGKENFPKNQYTKLREPLKGFFDEARFLRSLVAEPGRDPLAEDWEWSRRHMLTLLKLAREFSGGFSEQKNSDGVLDFQDLEQFALKLLWDFETDGPTAIARRWREQLRFVLVDEYQDINAAQDRIIQAFSREAGDANRFLVGDVKQSIYRFRLAAPAIFRGYARDWTGKTGTTISLTENFRSHRPILDFTNALFTQLMRDEVGGVQYDEAAQLKPGTAIDPADTGPRVELLLRLKSTGQDSDGDDELMDLEESEKEARMLALRLRGLKETGYTVRGAAVEWRDMAILLRSPSGKAEVFAKQFEKVGVPLIVERGGFYDSSEIADLLCLLRLLDNPLQDVPLIAVLRSPLVGLSLDELAQIRLLSAGRFWFALTRTIDPKSSLSAETQAKTGQFLDRFARWRKSAKQMSLSQCLEEILDETYYAGWLAGQRRGAQRVANVERLLYLAQKFDQFQRQGLFRFLQFIEAQREAEVEPELAPAAAENAVRLLSIHQSKGLEFPVVALADLAKTFNLRDLRDDIIFDETFGLGPRIKPPGGNSRYPSLPHWLAQKHQRRELAGEELRLLYVACTRARDLLLLSGGLSRKKWENVWTMPSPMTTRDILTAASHADWIGLWFRNHVPATADVTCGESTHLRWRIVADEELSMGAGDEVSPGHAVGDRAPDDATVERLRQVLDWRYGHDIATRRAAKSTVTALRREANADLPAEAEEWFPPRRILSTSLSAADTGLAHHKFLQHILLKPAMDAVFLEREADRLLAENILSKEERAALDLEHLLGFWQSSVGKRILEQIGNIRRELPFTARFTLEELDQLLGTSRGGGPSGDAVALKEFIVVQGVADLVILLPDEIWLVDFKTDRLEVADLPGKLATYAPQLKLYARALEKIFGRPVKNCWLHFLELQRTEKV
ncbi:MAG TPA: UvrD-helicase domain-containing protein [Desulfuromonadaceae bacterium]|nr:UvrD-helicase domain-containing protein [Desulfuromonadaceae bacterium]